MEPSADATDAENCENIAENSTPGRSALLQVTPRLSRATKKSTTGSAKSVRWNMEPSADANDAENCENIVENSTPGRSALLQVTPRLSRATKKSTTGSAKSERWNMEPSADANDAENCENIAENST